MLENLGVRHDDEDATICGEILESTIASHLSEGGVTTYDLGGDANTVAVGTAISERYEALLNEHYT